MNKSTQYSIVSLDIAIPPNTSGYQDFIDILEGEIERLALRFPGVEPSVSSANVPPEGTSWEHYGVNVPSSGDVDAVADAMVGQVMAQTVPRDLYIVQCKREGGKRNVYSRRIWPMRDTSWRPEREVPPGNALQIRPEDLPTRLQYLYDSIQRYYGVGGKDVFFILQDEADLRAFAGSLSSDDRAQLAKDCEAVLQNGDNRWIVDWVSTDTHNIVAKAQALYYLALLDRLQRSGFFSGEPFANRQVLDWSQLDAG